MTLDHDHKTIKVVKLVNEKIPGLQQNAERPPVSFYKPGNGSNEKPQATVNNNEEGKK